MSVPYAQALCSLDFAATQPIRLLQERRSDLRGSADVSPARGRAQSRGTCPRRPEENEVYYRISRHYGWAFGKIFDDPQQYQVGEVCHQ